MSTRQPTVEATNNCSGRDLDLSHWVAIATETLVAEHITTGSVDLLFVDVDVISQLNQTHLGHQGPTDVLSFPLDEPLEADGHDLRDDVPVHLGDIVICPDVAEAQAPDHCGDLDAELTLLLIHGVLHLLGHDHAEPGEQEERMVARERHHLARYGHRHPGPQR